MPAHRKYSDDIYEKIDRALIECARRAVHVTDLQIANAADLPLVGRQLIKNRRHHLKIGRLTPKRKYQGNGRERNLQAVQLYRQGNPDVDRRAQFTQRAKYTVLIFNHFGAFCHHPDAGPNNCSRQLEIHHVNHDGKMHRLAVGSSKLSMYRFVWKLVIKGPQTDRFGKLWKEEDFAILCRSHNAREQ